MPSLRACGARPSRGMSQGEVALRGRAGDSAKGGFLGGARSPRPDCKAVRTPRHFISTTCVDDDQVANRRQRWSWRCAIAGVRSPPLRETGTPQGEPAASKARCIGKSRCRHYGRAEPAPPGGASGGEMALRGRPGDGAEGGFLGGTRSPRPHCRAGRMARTFITAGGYARGR